MYNRKNRIMKNIRKYIIVISLIIAALFIYSPIYAQPDPPGGHGQSGDAPGGGAPIGSGIVLTVLMGIAYAGKKVYNWRE